MSIRRAVLLCSMLLIGSCAAPPAVKTSSARDVANDASDRTPHIDKCRIDAVINAPAHRLEATAKLSIAGAPVDVMYLLLNPSLGLDSVTENGTTLSFKSAGSGPAGTGDDSDVRPARYAVTMPASHTEGREIVVKYGGALQQNVAAGEKAGEIHNTTIHAHIGSEGIYLDDGGFWYPTIDLTLEAPASDSQPATGRRREMTLTSFELHVARVAGMMLTASGNPVGSDADRVDENVSTWTTPFPLPGLVLVGGPHVAEERVVDGLPVRVELSRDHGSFAPAILDAAETYLKLYQPLLGHFPYARFTIVENFFSSGFAFPGFTVLSSEVIAMGEGSLRPGYLDHEMLHNWWGNGVFVSELDGNWCECLTTYCANYMRPVLQGDVEHGRKFRRDACYDLSRLSPERDKPLDRFDRPDGPGRTIGYTRGAMVFAMLADRIGQEVMWTGLRRLYRERLGRPTGWNDIRTAFETASGRDLHGFFDAWVRHGGLPEITIDEAAYEPGGSRLMLSFSQRGTAFDVDVPIRIGYADRVIDRGVHLLNPFDADAVRLLNAPQYVDLDPDYRVLRRVPPAYIMPTISGLRPPLPLTVVRDPGEDKLYASATALFRERYENDAELFKVSSPGEFSESDLVQGHVLFLGAACRTPPAAECLSGTLLQFHDRGFEAAGDGWNGAGDAVLCSVVNPRNPTATVSCYHGNAEAALQRAALITFYGGDSLIVFQNGKPVRRRQFERPQRMMVESDGSHAGDSATPAMPKPSE